MHKDYVTNHLVVHFEQIQSGRDGTKEGGIIAVRLRWKRK